MYERTYISSCIPLSRFYRHNNDFLITLLAANTESMRFVRHCSKYFTNIDTFKPQTPIGGSYSSNPYFIDKENKPQRG